MIENFHALAEKIITKHLDETWTQLRKKKW